MPRRRVMTVKKIYEERAAQWAFHYKNRAFASSLCELGWSGASLSAALRQDYPVPSLQIDGSMLDVPLRIRCECETGLLSRFRLVDRVLLCLWYWTLDDWQEFVRQYQALPDVCEDYYYRYDREGDRALLVPMSSKPKQGSLPVDNLAKKGTSVELRGSFRCVPVDGNRYIAA